MSFVPNSAQQISLFDKLAFLSKRKQNMIEKSWAKAFSDHIFSRINEHIFKRPIPAKYLRRTGKLVV